MLRCKPHRQSFLGMLRHFVFIQANCVDHYDISLIQTRQSDDSNLTKLYKISLLLYTCKLFLSRFCLYLWQNRHFHIYPSSRFDRHRALYRFYMQNARQSMCIHHARRAFLSATIISCFFLDMVASHLSNPADNPRWSHDIPPT